MQLLKNLRGSKVTKIFKVPKYLNVIRAPQIHKRGRRGYQANETIIRHPLVGSHAPQKLDYKDLDLNVAESERQWDPQHHTVIRSASDQFQEKQEDMYPATQQTLSKLPIGQSPVRCWIAYSAPVMDSKFEPGVSINLILLYGAETGEIEWKPFKPGSLVYDELCASSMYGYQWDRADSKTQVWLSEPTEVMLPLVSIAMPQVWTLHIVEFHEMGFEQSRMADVKEEGRSFVSEIHENGASLILAGFTSVRRPHSWDSAKMSALVSALFSLCGGECHREAEYSENGSFGRQGQLIGMGTGRFWCACSSSRSIGNGDRYLRPYVITSPPEDNVLSHGAKE
nr:protein phosphatase 2C 77-like [Ipomoea batatas]